MAGKITNGDIAILSYVAEYKFLTVKQLSALTQRSFQVVRRRLRFLMENKLIAAGKQLFGNGPGPRESVLDLTGKGLELLEGEGILSRHAKYITDRTSGSMFIEHDLLVNWFFIHLLQIERVNPQFKVRHVTVSSHCISEGDPERPFLMERTAVDNLDNGSFIMIPDGVFVISNRESGKTVLFFLETDMGTESLVKSDRSPGDIHHKITGYQELYRSNRYKRYEKVFNAKLNGFRLLFLTTNIGRLKSVGDLVQTMKPSDFIWVADQRQMFSHGISARIWSRGGRYDKPSESILGRELAFETPVVGNIR